MDTALQLGGINTEVSTSAAEIIRLEGGGRTERKEIL